MDLSTDLFEQFTLTKNLRRNFTTYFMAGINIKWVHTERIMINKILVSLPSKLAMLATASRIQEINMYLTIICPFPVKWPKKSFWMCIPLFPWQTNFHSIPYIGPHIRNIFCDSICYWHIWIWMRGELMPYIRPRAGLVNRRLTMNIKTSPTNRLISVDFQSAPLFDTGHHPFHQPSSGGSATNSRRNFR